MDHTCILVDTNWERVNIPRWGKSWFYIKRTDFSNSPTENSFHNMVSRPDIGQSEPKHWEKSISLRFCGNEFTMSYSNFIILTRLFVLIQF